VSPHREIPSEKLFLSVNRQAIVISLSFYPCRELPVGLPSELIFLTVLPYIPDGFWHTGKFRFLVVSDPFFLLWFAGYAFGVTREWVTMFALEITGHTWRLLHAGNRSLQKSCLQPSYVNLFGWTIVLFNMIFFESLLWYVYWAYLGHADFWIPAVNFDGLQQAQIWIGSQGTMCIHEVSFCQNH